MLFAALTIAAERWLSNFNPQEVANTAWALATVNYRAEKLFASLAIVSERRPSDFKPQEVANSAWAFAIVKYMDERLFAALAIAAERRLRYDDINQARLQTSLFYINDNTAMRASVPSRQDYLSYVHTLSLDSRNKRKLRGKIARILAGSAARKRRGAGKLMLDEGEQGSTTLGAMLSKLSSTLGTDVRPQKRLVKELLLAALRERAAVA